MALKEGQLKNIYEHAFYREDMKFTCDSCNEEHIDGLKLHPRCHPEALSRVYIYPALVVIVCAECNHTAEAFHVAQKPMRV